MNIDHEQLKTSIISYDLILDVLLMITYYV